jgi:hypothetical protein
LKLQTSTPTAWAFCEKRQSSLKSFKLLWNYKRCFNIHHTWHTCWLDHSLCHDLLSYLSNKKTYQNCQNITILRWPFPSELISKWFNFTMEIPKQKERPPWQKPSCFPYNWIKYHSSSILLRKVWKCKLLIFC